MVDPGGGHPPPESQLTAQVELLFGQSHDNLYAIADKGLFLYMLN